MINKYVSLGYEVKVSDLFRIVRIYPRMLLWNGRGIDSIGVKMKTETEIYNDMTKSEADYAVKYKYSNYLFRIKVKETMEGYKQKKISDAELVAWIKKLLEEI